MTTEIMPFTSEVPQAELDDLRTRLSHTRWPEAATVDDRSQGIPLGRVQQLTRLWSTDYEWRATEHRLNSWPQYRTALDGLGVHFVHARSPHSQARPLLLTHGWPGSILEFGKIIAPLIDPTNHGGQPGDAFHVIAPSLPGYGFSDRPGRAGWGIERIAAAWAELMALLGYTRYLAAGSDWGTSITTLLAGVDDTHVAGIHLIPPLAPPNTETFPDITTWERQALCDLDAATTTGSAYSDLHRTRPQTIGYGLLDSPVALCAWLAEKYDAWSDTDPATALTDTDILDAVTLYWVTRTGASAARLYWESIDTVSAWFTNQPGQPVQKPVGATVCAHETPRISQRWASARFPDIRLWRHHERGGHFAALEVPDLLIDDLRALARLIW